MGSRSGGPKIIIQEIRQVKDVIYILAIFDEDGPTYLPTVGNPAQVVTVSKTNMTQFGQIAFKLIDQIGTERASTNGTLTSP